MAVYEPSVIRCCTTVNYLCKSLMRIPAVYILKSGRQAAGEKELKLPWNPHSSFYDLILHTKEEMSQKFNLYLFCFYAEKIVGSLFIVAQVAAVASVVYYGSCNRHSCKCNVQCFSCQQFMVDVYKTLCVKGRKDGG